MNLGLGSSLKTAGNVSTSSIITDGLVLKSNLDTGAVTPISNGSAFFDGSNDYITIADNSNLSFGDSSNDSAFSISAWINMTDATDFAIINKGVYNTSAEWHLRTNSSDKLVFALYDESVSSTHESIISANAITSYEGEWIHIACTYTGVGGTSANGGSTMYLNGVDIGVDLSGAGTYVAMENLAAAVTIGTADAGGAKWADGYICNVGIWSAALTAAQIKSIMYKNYSGLTSSETTNLVSWWNLSADANDNHGSNNGTLS